MTRSIPRLAPRRRQRGIAAILLVVFVGLALIVTVHGVFRAVRGAQERTLAAHAQTPAQATAWNGAEGLRRYLDIVDARTVRAWYAAKPSAEAPVALTLGGTGAARLGAQVVNVTKLIEPADPTHPDDDKFTVTARLTGSAGAGNVAASSMVEAVYDLTLAKSSPLAAAEPPALNFFRDLVISGDVRFSGAEHAQVNVLGNVTITSTNLTGVEQINATGNVSVDSAVKLDRVHANGNVRLMQGSDSQIVKARGTVLLSGGGRHGYVQANDTVTFNSSEAVKVETRGGLITGDPVKSCNTPAVLNYDGTYIAEARVQGAVDWFSCGGGVKDLQGNGSLMYRGADQIGYGASSATRYRANQHLRTRGDMLIRSAESTGRYTALGPIVSNSSSHPHIGMFCTQAALSVMQYNSTWSTVVGYGATVNAADPRNLAHIRPLATMPAGVCDFGFGTVAVPEVPVYTRDKPVIDANVLKGQANLAFELDAAGEIQVTVKSLKDVADGVYALGYNAIPYPQTDWLCRKDDLGPPETGKPQRKCNAPIRKICENNGLDSCFQRDSATVTTWTLNSWTATTVARGVLWFKGNLKLGAKGYVNTLIATGDIDLVGNAAVMAPNYAGYTTLCTNADFPGMSSSVQSPDLAGLYALNFCNPSAGVLIENRMGNVALIAGSYDGDKFSGGNIRTANGNRIDGSVMAGNKLQASGNTTVGGNVIGAGQGGDAGPSGLIGNTFRLEFPSIPGYAPGALPCTSKSCMGNQARLHWARYR